MALSITSNFSINAGYAANNMRSSQTLMGKSINRISSGLRAPKPADDIISYVSGTKLKTDSAGYTALSTNVQDTAAKLNMMDAVLADAGAALVDLKNYANQYASAGDGTGNATTDQTTIDTAYQTALKSVKAISATVYKGEKLFVDTVPTNDVNVFYGFGTSDALGINKDFYLDPNADSSGILKDVPDDLSTQIASPVSNITNIQTAIDNITDRRAAIGGYTSALEAISNYLSDTAAAADAAYTAVTEVDMAKEMTAYVRNNIQTQASQAMVAQANQSLAQVLNLLQV